MSYAATKHVQQNRILGFERTVKSPEGERVNQLINAPAPGSMNIFSTPRNFNRNQRAYQFFKSWVFVATSAIATRLASQPVLAAELLDASPNPTTDRERARRIARQKAFERTAPSFVSHKMHLQQDVEILTSHPALDAIGRPNPVQRKFEFLYMLALNYLITGECYWIGHFVDDDESLTGERLEMWAVPTTWIIPDHSEELFGSYGLKLPGQALPQRLPDGVVARTYMPDPSDIKLAYSKLSAIVEAISVDDSLQNNQQQMFERGINPNLIITMAKARGPDGNTVDRRPRLTGAQRRQIIRAVREMWNSTVSYGDPAIIDGLIESVHKLQMSPQEMDFIDSGKVVKERIMEAYHVNPYIVGQITGVNRAQAVEATRVFYDQAVNPLLNAISETMTSWIGPLYEEPQRLLVYVKPAEVKDPELEIKRWTEGRKNGDVTRDEWRAAMVDLPPLEDEDNERSPLLTNPATMNGVIQMLNAVGSGTISGQQASQVFQLFFEISEEEADALVESGIETVVEPEINEDEIAERLREEVESRLQAASVREQSNIDSRMKRLASGLETALEQFDKEQRNALGDQFKSAMEDMKSKAEQQLERNRNEIARLADGIRHTVSMVGMAYSARSKDDQAEQLLQKSYDAMGNMLESIKLEAIRPIEIKQEAPVFQIPSPTIQVDVQAPNVNVEPPAVTVEPHIDVQVPETNVTVQSLQGEKGDPGPTGPKGDKGDPSDVNVNVSKDSAKTAVIRHADGTTSSVQINDESQGD